MKVNVLFILFFFIISNDIFSKKISQKKIEHELNKISKNQLINDLRGFTNCCFPNKTVGTKGHLLAVKYISDFIQKYDPQFKKNFHVMSFAPDINYAVELYKSDFTTQIVGKFSPSSPTFKKWKNFLKSVTYELKKLKSIKGQNLIWEKKGRENPGKILILGAHYDGLAVNGINKEIMINGEMPGADNNATGVVALLNLIKILSRFELKNTIRIIFFDFEELGQLGSYAYVNKNKNLDKVVGFFNLEMLGHDTKIDDKEKKYGNFKAYIRGNSQFNLEQKNKKLASIILSKGRFYSKKIHFEIFNKAPNNTPANHFWMKMIPSVLLTHNWESDFNIRADHNLQDFPETLNWDSYYSSFRFIVGPVLSWALLGN